MRKLISLLMLAGIAYLALHETGVLRPFAHESTRAASAIEQAYSTHSNNLQVRGDGEVVRILPDDLNGRRHQRFILQLASGQTVLVAHNIDLAPRIPDLATGDSVEFYGEYDWNERGGVVHWTHHDPAGSHIGGWLKHAGRTYE